MREGEAIAVTDGLRSSIFFGTLIVFAVMDVLLLLWLFHPFTELTGQTGGQFVSPSPRVQSVAVDDSSKPSPFTVLAARKHSIARMRRVTHPFLTSVRFDSSIIK